MVLPSLAATEALEARIGATLTGSDLVRAQAMLDDASALIRSEAGLDYVDEFGELETVPPIIEAITLAAAYRAYRNPDGVSQSSVGDVSVSYGRDRTMASIYLTPAERAAIRKAAGASAVLSIGLVSPWVGAETTVNYYVPVEGGGDMLPLGPLPWELI
jgi:hypothetical protein